jgi:hypothetical protein
MAEISTGFSRVSTPDAVSGEFLKARKPPGCTAEVAREIRGALRVYVLPLETSAKRKTSCFSPLCPLDDCVDPEVGSSRTGNTL